MKTHKSAEHVNTRLCSKQETSWTKESWYWFTKRRMNVAFTEERGSQVSLFWIQNCKPPVGNNKDDSRDESSWTKGVDIGLGNLFLFLSVCLTYGTALELPYFVVLGPAQFA